MADKKLFSGRHGTDLLRPFCVHKKRPRITSGGMNTSALRVYSANTLLEVLAENPAHIGVAFDTSALTFRHVRFEAYKVSGKLSRRILRWQYLYVIRPIKA